MIKHSAGSGVIMEPYYISSIWHEKIIKILEEYIASVWLRHHVFVKQWYTSAKFNGVWTQKTKIWFFTPMKTLNLNIYNFHLNTSSSI